MSVRPDNRLADAPMEPVVCEACAARVWVRKSSWEQTSVQWDAESLALCRTRAQLPGPDVFLGCPQLRSSIEAAAYAGRLHVLDDRLSGQQGDPAGQRHAGRPAAH